jgi:hypothetical protein
VDIGWQEFPTSKGRWWAGLPNGELVIVFAYKAQRPGEDDDDFDQVVWDRQHLRISWACGKHDYWFDDGDDTGMKWLSGAMYRKMELPVWNRGEMK